MEGRSIESFESSRSPERGDSGPEGEPVDLLWTALDYPEVADSIRFMEWYLNHHMPLVVDLDLTTRGLRARFLAQRGEANFRIITVWQSRAHLEAVFGNPKAGILMSSDGQTIIDDIVAEVGSGNFRPMKAEQGVLYGFVELDNFTFNPSRLLIPSSFFDPPAE